MELFKENFISHVEQPEPRPAKVSGCIPQWVHGTFLRVGPGKFDLGDFTLNHWLDGMAVLYKYSIDNGQVTFRSKYLRSDAYKKACVAGRPVFTEFGTHSYPDPCKNIFSRMFSNFDCHAMTDNASNNVICVEDQVFVASETCFLRRVDPHTLDTREKVDLNKYVSVNFASSHPLKDSQGYTYNLAGSFTGGPRYHIIRTPPTSNSITAASEPWHHARILTTLHSSWRASFGYYHSFGMSEDHLVFLEQPLLVNTLKLATSQVKNRSMYQCIEWHPQEKVKFNLLRKATGEQVKVRYVCDEPFFTFHHVNTYEVKGHVVVDLIAYDSPEVLEKLYLNKVRANEYSSRDPPQLRRFVLPLVLDMQSVPENQELVTLPGTTASAVKVRDSSGNAYIRLTPVDVGEPGFEMPVVNPRLSGKPYQYVYGTGGYEKAFYKNSVCKVCVDSGRAELWRGNEYQYPSEPVFLPDPEATEEDAGLLITSVVDVRPDHEDFMLVLEARSMREVARAHVDVAVPNGLHGVFLNERL